MPELSKDLPSKAKAKPRHPRRYRSLRPEPIPFDRFDPRQTAFDLGEPIETPPEWRWDDGRSPESSHS
jgi:hypothetical protein